MTTTLSSLFVSRRRANRTGPSSASDLSAVVLLARLFILIATWSSLAHSSNLQLSSAFFDFNRHSFPALSLLLPIVLIWTVILLFLGVGSQYHPAGPEFASFVSNMTLNWGATRDDCSVAPAGQAAILPATYQLWTTHRSTNILGREGLSPIVDRWAKKGRDIDWKISCFPSLPFFILLSLLEKIIAECKRPDNRTLTVGRKNARCPAAMSNTFLACLTADRINSAANPRQARTEHIITPLLKGH